MIASIGSSFQQALAIESPKLLSLLYNIISFFRQMYHLSISHALIYVFSLSFRIINPLEPYIHQIHLFPLFNTYTNYVIVFLTK